MRRALGVDLGGTKTAVALVSANGHLGEVVTAPTPASQGGQAVLDTVAQLAAQLADGVEDLVGLGIGTAGIVDATAGRIIGSNETFADWVGTDVAAGLRERLGWDDTRHISVLNDVDAHAMGEYRFGAGRGLESLLMVGVGTGVGGAVVLGDGLRTGAHHVAGEMGHIPTPGADGMRCPCGRLGHLEALAAGPSMERRYRELGGDPVDGRELMRRAADGDAIALEVVRAGAAGLARAIAGIVTVLDPASVVIGGGVAEAGQVWWTPLLETLRAELVPALADIPVLKALLGPSAAIVGAAAHVFASEEQA